MTHSKIKKSLLVAIGLVASGVAHAGASNEAEIAMVSRVIDKHILPHVDALKVSAAALAPAVEAVCQTGSAAARSDLQKKFHATVEAFAGADFLRFGPMLEGGLRERISFWPDPRGFVGRQLRLIMLNKDESVVKADVIGKQSAAVQGLPALEVLMTDKDTPLGPGEPAKFRCAVARGIAGNVALVSQQIADGWEKSGGWKDKMLHPGPANDTYKSAGESASELVKAFLVGISLTSDLQVKPQVDAKLKLVPPFDKSGLRSAYYVASVNSLRSFYDLLAIDAFLKPDKQWMKNWVKGAWRAIQSSDGVGGLVKNAERDEAPPPREVFDKMNQLRRLVATEMSMAAGLTVGFNELDGD